MLSNNFSDYKNSENNLLYENKIYLFSYPICPISFKIKIIFKILGVNYTEIVINNKFDFDSCVQKYSIKSFPSVMFIQNESSIENSITLENTDFFRNKGIFFNEIFTLITYLNTYYRLDLLSNLFKNFKILELEEFFGKSFHFLVYYKTVYTRTIKNIIDGISGFNVHESNIGEITLKEYLTEINEMLKFNKYITGDELSLPDISLFCYISSLDYFNYISWYSYINLKNWYIKMCNNSKFNFIFDYYIHGVQKSSTFGKFRS